MKPNARTALFAATAIVVGRWAWAGIEGSKHDFSKKEWSGGEPCGVCHSGGSDKPPTAAPLWDENADLNRTFGTPLVVAKSAGAGTTICLRCHDGTIARDTVTERSRQRFANRQYPALFRAGHQTSDHPVGIDYPQYDKHYRPITTVLSRGLILLPDGKVECVSCHDPHNASGQDHMLVMSNSRSALCLTCHRK